MGRAAFFVLLITGDIISAKDTVSGKSMMIHGPKRDHHKQNENPLNPKKSQSRIRTSGKKTVGIRLKALVFSVLSYACFRKNTVQRPKMFYA